MAIMHKGTSPATLEANRANSLQSTGPVTERGPTRLPPERPQALVTGGDHSSLAAGPRRGTGGVRQGAGGALPGARSPRRIRGDYRR
jgi:hypothetical protein